MYANITYINNTNPLSGFEIYICPNCDSNNFFKDLDKDCEHCHKKIEVGKYRWIIKNIDEI